MEMGIADYSSDRGSGPPSPCNVIHDDLKDKTDPRNSTLRPEEAVEGRTDHNNGWNGVNGIIKLSV